MIIRMQQFVTTCQLFLLFVRTQAVPLNRQEGASINQNIKAIAGASLTLPCPIMLTGDEVCQWTKDGFGLGTDPNLPGFPRLTLGPDCVLKFDPVLVEDDGYYSCQVGQPASVVGGVSLRVEAEPGQPFIVQVVGSKLFEVDEGQRVELECRTSGAKPPAQLVWLDNNGRPLLRNTREVVTKMEDGKSFLTVSIIELSLTEHIDIQCSAKSESFPSPRDSRTLSVKIRSKPKVSLTLSKPVIEEGEEITATCKVQSAYPAAVTYKWFINNNLISGQEEDSLRLEHVSREHNMAMVKCVVGNEVGRTEAVTTLKVNFSPKILHHPESQVARSGERVTFSCKAEGNPSPRYLWVRLGEIGIADEVVGVTQDLSLVTSVDTEGQYVCKTFIEGQAVLSSNTADLQLMKSPVVELEETRNAQIGEDVVLQCQVTSLSPNTTVTWTKAGAPLKPDSGEHRVLHDTRDSLNINSDLVIFNMGEEDFSEYGCFAANEVGTDYRKVELVESGQIGWLAIAIIMNTVLGVVILLTLLIYQFTRRHTTVRKLPQVEKSVLPPIYRGEDNEVFDELLLTNQMYEEYNNLNKEYSDNKINEHCIDVKIV